MGNFRAEMSDDRQNVTLTDTGWRTQIAAADLPRWAALYEALADRKQPRTGERAAAATSTATGSDGQYTPTKPRASHTS